MRHAVGGRAACRTGRGSTGGGGPLRVLARVSPLAGGQTARANGWLARSESLIAQAGVECPASGYLLIPQGLAALEAATRGRAQELGARAADIGTGSTTPICALQRLCQDRRADRTGEPAAGWPSSTKSCWR